MLVEEAFTTAHTHMAATSSRQVRQDMLACTKSLSRPFSVSTGLELTLDGKDLIIIGDSTN